MSLVLALSMVGCGGASSRVDVRDLTDLGGPPETVSVRQAAVLEYFQSLASEAERIRGEAGRLDGPAVAARLQEKQTSLGQWVAVDALRRSILECAADAQADWRVRRACQDMLLRGPATFTRELALALDRFESKPVRMMAVTVVAKSPELWKRLLPRAIGLYGQKEGMAPEPARDLVSAIGGFAQDPTRLAELRPELLKMDSDELFALMALATRMPGQDTAASKLFMDLFASADVRSRMALIRAISTFKFWVDPWIDMMQAIHDSEVDGSEIQFESGEFLRREKEWREKFRRTPKEDMDSSDE